MNITKLIISPPDLSLNGFEVRRVTAPDDYRVEQTLADINRRALESYERSCQDNMRVLEKYGKMFLN